MKNIGIIVDCLQGGGAERCAADLSVYFEQHGYKVFFFTDLSIKPSYEYKGELVHFTYKLDNSANPLAGKVEELRKLKDLYNIDIAISFMQFANMVNILSKGTERVILTTHSVNSIYAKYENSIFWSGETFKELYQYADLITVPSEYCKNDWIEHYGDKNHITRTLYNPVHSMKVDSLSNKENIVITTGRMQPIKRQWHLIRAFKSVRERCPDSKLIILGDGELRSKLEKLVEKLELQDCIEMPGNVKNVEAYLKKAKVFAMTSYCEAMSCSVLEALSAGVPVVSCDSPGGIREELEITSDKKVITEPLYGSCGIVTPYIKTCDVDELTGEEKMLADEIVHLLIDDNLRQQMVKNAYRVADKFSVEMIGKQWLNAVERLEERKVADTDLSGFNEIKERCFESFSSKENINVDMYVSYYRLLEKWMKLKEHGKSVREFFEKNNIKSIIIYGLGKMADHLLEDLKESDVRIVCAVDKRAIYKYMEFPVITETDVLPEADCIVITPVYEAKEIQRNLQEKTTNRLITLSDVLGM